MSEIREVLRKSRELALESINNPQCPLIIKAAGSEEEEVRELRLEDIVPGTTISGLEEYKELRIIMQEVIWVWDFLEGLTARKPYYWEGHQLVHDIPDQINKRFLGKLQNPKITIIPVDEALIRCREPIIDRALSHITAVELKSTGKLPVEQLFLTTTVPRFEKTYYKDGIVRRPEIAQFTRPVRKRGELTGVEKIISESREDWAMALREAYAKAGSAGLPTLGKRR